MRTDGGLDVFTTCEVVAAAEDAFVAVADEDSLLPPTGRSITVSGAEHAVNMNARAMIERLIIIAGEDCGSSMYKDG